MSGRIAIAGSVAQRPYRAGHTWVFLQYLLGFRRLGWEVLLLDRLEPDMCTDAEGQPAPAEASVQREYLRRVVERFELGEALALLDGAGRSVLGLDRAEARAWLREADLLLNFMGFLDDEELLSEAACRVFVDIDPGFGQIWRERGLADVLSGHDRFVTIGERIGEPSCGVPTCGLSWIPTRQPVVLNEWPARRAETGGAFTSVATWRGEFGPLEFDGRRLGLRVHEFRKFVSLPARTGRRFDLALDIDPAETRDLTLLRDRGWRLLDPLQVAGSPDAYRRFVRGSMAEFTVAKNLYVETRSGWFSDRSICYLASGRPVVTQDTGLDELLPTGEGLLVYSDLDGAIEAVERVAADPIRHGRAAREIAECCFDSDRVLERLLGALAIAPEPVRVGAGAERPGP